LKAPSYETGPGKTTAATGGSQQKVTPGPERDDRNPAFPHRKDGTAFPKWNKICTIKLVERGTFLSSRASEVTALIKQDIVHHVIERTGLPRTKAEAAVDTVFEGLKEALAAGERIELRGFGVFSVRARKTGIGRNPRTGTEVSITPGKAVRFKPGKELHTLSDGVAAPKSEPAAH
jgi:nucleoid DNA-binding protein